MVSYKEGGGGGVAPTSFETELPKDATGFELGWSQWLAVPFFGKLQYVDLFRDLHEEFARTQRPTWGLCGRVTEQIEVNLTRPYVYCGWWLVY